MQRLVRLKVFFFLLGFDLKHLKHVFRNETENKKYAVFANMHFY